MQTFVSYACSQCDFLKWHNGLLYCTQPCGASFRFALPDMFQEHHAGVACINLKSMNLTLDHKISCKHLQNKQQIKILQYLHEDTSIITHAHTPQPNDRPRLQVNNKFPVKPPRIEPPKNQGAKAMAESKSQLCMPASCSLTVVHRSQGGWLVTI